MNFASSARYREKLHTIAKPIVDELADETGERVAIAQEEHGQAVWLYYSESSEAVITDAHIGISLDLFCTAIRKIILAFNFTRFRARPLEHLVVELDNYPKFGHRRFQSLFSLTVLLDLVIEGRHIIVRYASEVGIAFQR